MKSIVIFGAGSGGMMAKWMLEDFGWQIIAFTDNNASKWGTVLDGLPVISPQELKKSEADIVIASTWEAEIKKQLIEMGLYERIRDKETFLHQYMMKSAKEYSYIRDIPVDSTKRVTFLFGTDLGLYQGGVESWTYTLADELRKRGYDTKILTSEISPPAPERFSKDTYYLNMRGRKYCSGLRDTIDVMLENAPCVVIDSWQSMTMLAASMIKIQSKEALPCLIEVVHNDLPRLFRSVKQFEDQIDYCMGVSTDINRKLIEDHGVDDRKVRYKESPICFEHVDRDYALDAGQVIRIGYAARLVKSQKRADLLIPLVEKLLQKKVDFRLQIAGNGALSGQIEEFIKERHLEEKVTLMGFLPREQMKSFWSDQDIFIHVSEYEGVSLSMLEAIGYGCVPVVFKVAGSGEFIDPEIGYVCENGNLDEMADRIQYLDRHRDRIKEMGTIGSQSIRAKCDVREYVNYLLKMTKES